MYSSDGGVNQANSMAQSVQSLKQSERTNNNAVADAYNQQIKQNQTADYIQGASDIFKTGKSVEGLKSAISNNSSKYMKPDTAGKLVSKGMGLSEEAGARISRVGGALGGLAVGGEDLFKDIKQGGIAGDNWAKQGANLSDIVGSGLTALSLVDPMFAPLELIGAESGVLSDVLGAVGDGVDASKEDATAQDTEQSQTESITNQESISQSGGLATGRTE
jgi:hypothetical protein|tara:strand:+ start:1986 stop:2642 length:657 start_codon:yes stop_codon:yes gene_type:complete